MIIHSIISMDDIFNTPEYLKENAECVKNNASTTEQSEKKEEPFSTDPSVYLKYLL